MKKAKSSRPAILITCVSKKVPLVNAVKDAIVSCNLDLVIIGADSNTNVVGRYFVDKFVQLPTLSSANDLMKVIDLCKKLNIKFIIPTRDSELLFWSINKAKLYQHGISVMISDIKAIQLTADKLLFSNSSNFKKLPIIESSEKIDKLTANKQKFVVKERFGAGSHKMGINLTKNEAIKHAKELDHPIFQPFIDGDEYSVDAYIDRLGQVRGIICRRRQLVIDGESQISVTESVPKLDSLAADLLQSAGFYGHVILQVIRSKDNSFHIIEINARFGGASTLSVRAGLKSFEWFITESMGESIDTNILSFKPSSSIITQVRYPTDKYIYI